MSSWVVDIWTIFVYVLQCCAVYRIGRFVLNLLKLIYVYFIAPRLGIGFKFQTYCDKWTVITGPTDGIGKEYLRQLAAKGLRKFLLVSRDQKKLEQTSQWLLSSYPDCEIRIRAFTFGRDSYDSLREELNDLDIGILVNNAGTAPTLLQRFGADSDTDRLIYKVNTESVFELMQMVLSKMAKAKCGAIVNVSSLQSIRPITLLASYSASKVYIAYLSECAYRAYKSDGITVQCLIPVIVYTKIMQYESDDISSFDDFIMVSAETYAKEAVNTLGVTSYTTGCWFHELQLIFTYIVPWWLLRFSAEAYYRYHQRRMIRGLNKKSAKNE